MLRKGGHELVTICIDATKGQYEYQYKRGPAKPVKVGHVMDSQKLNYEELPETPKSNFFNNAMSRLKKQESK